MNGENSYLSSPRPWLDQWLTAAALFSLVGAVLLAYAISFDGTFVFDDTTQILQNEAVHSLNWPFPFLQNTRRPFLMFTLALNWAWSGEDPWSYHLVNLGIHVLNTLLVFGVVSQARSLVQSGQKSLKEGWPSTRGVAWACALLWGLHPLQTESVTYVIQRAESLMGLFFLGTLGIAMTYFKRPERVTALTAGLFMLLGSLTKEVIAVVPLMIVVFDRCFVSGTFPRAWQRHKDLYGSLAFSWLVMGVLLRVMHPEKTPTAGFAYEGISVVHYALSQARAVTHYLRLAVWPSPLILDYSWPPEESVAKALPFLVFIGSLLAGAGILCIKRSWAGFWLLSFFLILSPSSSFIPLKDIIFEHRMYLPLLGVIVPFVEGWGRVCSRVSDSLRSLLFYGIVIGLAVAGGILTWQRNKVYVSEWSVWLDVTRKRPFNARAHNNLGQFLLRQGRVDDALPFLLRSARLDKDYPDVQANLCHAYARKKNYEKALEHCHRAVSVDPEFAVGYNNLGAVYSEMGQYARSIPYFKKALDLDFHRAGVYHNLGVAYAKTGRPYAALAAIEKALRLQPDFPEARDHLNEIRSRLQQMLPSPRPAGEK